MRCRAQCCLVPYNGSMSDPHDEDDDHGNSNIKPELSEIAGALLQISVEIRDGLAALAAAVTPLAEPKE